MNNILLVVLVAVAGGIGAVIRFLIDKWITGRIAQKFPWGIFIVNATGSFALGAVVGFLSGPIALILGTGLLGGYTTFSTASIDAFKLIGAKDFSRAATYALGMLVTCMVAAMLGTIVGLGIGMSAGLA